MSDAPPQARGDDVVDDGDDVVDDRPMEDEGMGSAPGTGARGFLAGMLLGTALGLTVALLFAPEPGDRTRRRIGKGLRRLRDRAEEETEELRERARKRLARVRR